LNSILLLIPDEWYNAAYPFRHFKQEIRRFLRK
jgi:hypothetical protein